MRINSEYVNISADNKDCYMLVESSNNEKCIHSYWAQQCRDSVDISFSSQTELAYECDDCFNGYRLLYSKGCHDCRDSSFLYDCRGCVDCIGCVNLRNCQYYVFNQSLGKEGYAKFLKEARLDTAAGVEEMERKFLNLEKSVRNTLSTNAQVIGNYNDAKLWCFMLRYCELRICGTCGEQLQDCMMHTAQRSAWFITSVRHRCRESPLLCAGWVLF